MPRRYRTEAPRARRTPTRARQSYLESELIEDDARWGEDVRDGRFRVFAFWSRIELKRGELNLLARGLPFFIEFHVVFWQYISPLTETSWRWICKASSCSSQKHIVYLPSSPANVSPRVFVLNASTSMLSFSNQTIENPYHFSHDSQSALTLSSRIVNPFQCCSTFIV